MAPIANLTYHFILWLTLPLLVVVTLSHSIRHRSKPYFLQRFGMGYRKRSDRPLWIHAASIGELRVALHLAESWRQQHPQKKIIITTASASSEKVFARCAPSFVEHCYLPLDHRSFCKRFIQAVQPSAALIIETELWLNLYQVCAQAGVAPIIINARLTSKTTSYVHLKNYYQACLETTKAVLARGESDRLAYIRLGASEEKTQAIGNLKYDLVNASSSQTISVPDTEYILCASTHYGEELMIAQAWQAEAPHSLPLLIAPRHIKRCNRIEKDLKRLGLNVVRLNEHTKADSDADIYLYDRFGGMDVLMRKACLVFLGGSLVPVGGHNIIEAARAHTPQVVGPCLDNVRSDVDGFLAQKGLLVVEDAEELVQAFRTVEKDRNAFAELADNADHYLQQQKGITQAYIRALEDLGVD